jgi:hypothetical protein
MAYMTRGSARSAAITRAAFRRRAREEVTPALFDNTPIHHDGLNLSVKQEMASPDAGSSSTSIPPTSRDQANESGEADLEAPAAGQNGGSGAEVVQTTVPSRAETPPAGAVRVCRDCWLSLPHKPLSKASADAGKVVSVCLLVAGLCLFPVCLSGCLKPPPNLIPMRSIEGRQP